MNEFENEVKLVTSTGGDAVVNQSERGPDMRVMSKAESDARNAMHELAKWCLANEMLLMQGRAMGFRMALSPAMKDLIATVATDRDLAMRVNANVLDLPS